MGLLWRHMLKGGETVVDCLLHEKTKRQKTKTKKRVYYCDVRAVSHSCDVFEERQTGHQNMTTMLL